MRVRRSPVNLRRNLMRYLFAFFVLFCACGETATVGTLGPPGDAAPPPDGGGATDAPAVVGEDAGPDATPPKNDGGSDAGPQPPAIDPLVVGHKWTFDVTEVANYPACPTGTNDVTVLDVAPRDGKNAYSVQSFCPGLPPVYYAQDGDVVLWDDSGTWVLVLDAPVQEGHTWTNGVITYVWHDLGSFTVPAGTFTQCFKAQDTAGPSYSVLCRGIGPVKIVYRDPSNNGYDAVLTAKNF
jgi:hypothetical protein